MTKKKTTSRTPSKAPKKKETRTPPAKDAINEAAAQPEPEAPEATPRDPNVARLYIVSRWKGLKNYECLFCAYATVDHEAALDHYKSEHTPPKKMGRIINTGLVDEDGAPITRVEPAEED